MRLTNSIRNQIIDAAVLKSGIPELKKELDKKIADWANRCRIHALGGAEEAKKIDSIMRRFAKATEKYPDNITRTPFKVDYDTFVNVGGLGYRVAFSPEKGCENRVHKVTPSQCVIPVGHDLTKEFDSLMKENQGLSSDERALRGEVRGSIDKITTVEKLIKVWPESKELIPPDINRVTNLPSIPVANLNKKIGLPTKK